MKIFGSITKLFELVFQNGSFTATVKPPTLSGNVTHTLPASTDTLVGRAVTEDLTNKTYNGVSVTSGTSTFTLTKDSATLTRSGAHTATLTTTNNTNVTLPTTGTLATLAGSEALTNKDVDGGTASNTNRITVPKDTKANLDSLTRKEGTIVYASDLDTLFADDGSALQPIGSGGAGKKNYITNPSASTSASTGWTAANMTVTRDTSTAIPRETTTKTAFKLVSTAGSSTATFLSDAILLDDADLSKKLGIELAIAVADGSNWTIDVLNSATSGGTYTRIPLPTDVSSVTYLPATTGTFKSSVDMDASKPYIKFKIVSVATAKTAYFSDITVTPDGNTVTGAVVGDWVSFTPANTGSWTANTTYTGKYRRVGNMMEVQVKAATSGAPSASTALLFNLPSGVTIDTSVLINSTSQDSILGQAYIITGSQGRALPAIVRYNSTTNVKIRYMDDQTYGVNDGGDVTDNSNGIFGAGDYVTAKFSVPIAEWAGSGTVNLAQNEQEFCFNATVSSAATNNTNFGYGPVGGEFPNAATVSTFITRRIRLQTPLQAGEFLIIEVDTQGSGRFVQVMSRVLDAATNFAIEPLYYSANLTAYVGISQPTQVAGSATDFDIYFGKYASSETGGTGKNDWNATGISSARWRVRKTSAGAAVSFGQVSENSSGLFPAYNTNLDNATATRLGLKQYLHGTTYNGGNAPTVTLAAGGGTLSSVTRALFLPYQTQDGTWRVRFNITLVLSAATRTGATIAINGMTFKNISNFKQAVNASLQHGSATFYSCYADANTSNIVHSHTSDSTANYQYSGDVELESKPSWSY
jgi:hypothetical protein